MRGTILVLIAEVWLICFYERLLIVQVKSDLRAPFENPATRLGDRPLLRSEYWRLLSTRFRLLRVVYLGEFPRRVLD